MSLSLEDIQDRLRNEDAPSRHKCTVCKGRGWALFYHATLGEHHIEKCDLCERFASDFEAEAHAVSHELKEFLAR